MTTTLFLSINQSPRNAPLWIAIGPIAGPVLARQAAEKIGNFENDAPGGLTSGIQGEVGTWVVVEDGDNGGLHQKVKNEDTILNVVLARQLTVREA